MGFICGESLFLRFKAYDQPHTFSSFLIRNSLHITQIEVGTIKHLIYIFLILGSRNRPGTPGSSSRCGRRCTCARRTSWRRGWGTGATNASGGSSPWSITPPLRRGILKSLAQFEKGEFSQLPIPIWMRQRSFSAWGLQTGPFAALEAHFVLKFFQLLHFHSGEPILITPEG